MDRPLVALVLAGGVGTRLYPATRNDRPKQFLPLPFDDGPSLLERTVSRVGFVDELYVLTRPSFADRVTDHAPAAGVLVEPAPRDTGPALVYGTHRVRELVGECAILAVPSDHHVSGAFESVLCRGARAAVETGGLVTFGIEPTRPATEYGYIEPGSSSEDESYLPVERFREKPSKEEAHAFVERGWYWNSGMFAWTPEALLAEARDSPLAPLIDALEAGDPESGFEAVDVTSVDYAIMERAEDAYVVPADLAWDDLGSWDALARVVSEDECGNVALGEGDGLAIDASDTVIASDDHHVSVVETDGLVVAAYDDRVLVVPRESAQRVREVVARLRDEGRF